MHRLTSRIVLVAWRGADWKRVSALIDAGVMPNAQRLVERGVLALTPALPPQIGPSLSTAMITGFRADEHGILTSTDCHPRTGRPCAPLSTTRRRKAIWNLLSERGARSLAIGWPAQYPVEPIDGVSVSTELFDAAAPADIPWTAPPDAVHPVELSSKLARLCLHPAELTGADLFPFIPNLASIDQKHDRRVGILASRLARDVSAHAVATSLMDSESWNFLAISYGLIEAASLELSELAPENEPQSAGDAYRRVAETSYRFCDMMLGRVCELAGDDSMIVLASPCGFRRSQHSTHPQITSGFFSISGPHAKRDELIHGATLLDLTPTILFALGLPIGRDMHGVALTTAFFEPGSPEYVSTWETEAESEANSTPGDCPMWKAQLEDLGYRDPEAEHIAALSLRIACERALNLAAVHASANRVSQAIEILEHLRAQQPDYEPCLLFLSLLYLASGAYHKASVLLPLIPDNAQTKAAVAALKSFLCVAAGDRKQALALLREADSSGPQFPMLAYGIGCIYLSLGKCAKAEAAFRRAADINPSYWLAEQGRAAALQRLGRLEEAAAAVRASLNENFAVPDSHRLLGATLLALGDRARALHAFRTARALSPTIH